MFEHYENYDRYIPDVMLKKHKKHEEYLNDVYAGMTHEEIYKSKLGTVSSTATCIGSPTASTPTTPWSCGPACTAGAPSMRCTPTPS